MIKNRRVLAYVLVIGLVGTLTLGYLSGLFIPIVPVQVLRLEIVTEKTEYRLGETINATFNIVNDYPFKVKITPFVEYTYSGNSDAEPDKVFVDVYITPEKGATILIPPGAKFTFERASFKPTLTGRFTIRVEVAGRSASLTLVVTK